VGFDAWKYNNGATLGRSGPNQRDSEVTARIAGFERRGVRGMRGDQLGGWNGLIRPSDITSQDRGEESVRK